MASIDASLARLGTDYVDLYQIHRWDGETPIEETMSALRDVVRAGKARYIGASTMYAWQFALTLPGFVSMQNHYNLLYREEEREMIPLCLSQGVPGVTAPIVGATKLSHLDDAVAAVGVRLTEDETVRLEAPYRTIPATVGP
jgi:aryl-alcohol dehydrogenase-like predicted oxidoreductase